VQPVAVRILHPGQGAVGPLQRELHDAHTANARRLATAFEAEGAADVLVVTGSSRAGSLGAVLRSMATSRPLAGGGTGLIVLGAGSIPLASRRDLRRLLDVAGSGERRALANNRYSADVIAIGQPRALADLPDIRADNGLPRWLQQDAGFEVDDLRSRWRLGVDLDSPLDVVLTGGPLDPSIEVALIRDRLARLRGVAADRRAELVVAGRTNAAALGWLERSTASRTRALIEERGFRASAPFAGAAHDRPMSTRPPVSVLGLLLDDLGPEAFGETLSRLGDAAVVDSRVLLAHRLGADERGWPGAEDRFASDLLLVDSIRDRWLRALTLSARDAAIPVLLGGHTLVGPGIRLALQPGR
jgi:hypothetical protein